MRDPKFLKIIGWSVLFMILLLGTLLKLMVFDGDRSTYSAYTPPSKPTLQSSDSKEASMDGILISIQAQDYKMLKADFGLKFKSSSDKRMFEKNEEMSRRAVLRYLSTMDANALRTEKGKEALRDALIQEMESYFDYDIETLYFKNFVLVP